jgi:RNA polymerase sigma-70 factor, ECF subfamily
VQRADRDAEFAAFVESRSRSLLSVAILLTGEYQRGEDLMQTALLTAYDNWARLRQPEAASAYVRQIMVTTSISWWRRRWRAEVPTEDVAEPSRPVPGLDSTQLVDGRTEMWPHIRALPPRQRAVLVLRYYEDLPVARIAELLGCTPGTVKSQTHKALATLRARLEAAEQAERGGVR